MAIGWAVLDIDKNVKQHVVAITSQETTNAGKKHEYRIILPQGPSMGTGSDSPAPE